MRTFCGSGRNNQANPLMGAVEGAGNGELSEQRGSFSSCLPSSLPLPWAGSGGLVFQTCLTLATLWTVACQDPLSMEFSRQEYWSGLPFPSPGDLPDPGIKPVSFVPPALAGRFFNAEPAGTPNYPPNPT